MGLGQQKCKITDMEKLIVDAEGKITIPPHVLERHGLRPGDELSLVEAADGLLVYQNKVDPQTALWLSSLSDDERRLALEEARRYESMSEEESDALWNEGTVSLDAGAETDEIDIPAK